MTMFSWLRGRRRIAANERAASIAEAVQAPNRATIAANVAEIRAKRGQVILNSILEDVISTGVSPSSCGGRHDGN